MIPPGPRSLRERLALIRGLLQNYVEAFTSAQELYGPIFQFAVPMLDLRYRPTSRRIRIQKICVLGCPELVAEMRKKRDAYDQSENYRELRPVIGDGLIALHNSEWRKVIPKVAPILQADAIQYYGGLVEQACDATIAEWDASGTDVRDTLLAVTRLAFRVSVHSFLSPGITDKRRLARLLDDFGLAGDWLHAYMDSPLKLPAWMSPVSSRRASQAARRLRRDTEELVSNPTCERSVISALKDAGLLPAQIRDFALTFLWAGFVTTSAALAWTLHLLASHPDDQERVRQSLPSYPFNREDLKGSKELTAAISEALRLYPPAPVVPKRVERPHLLGGYELTRGTSVLLMLPSIHRYGNEAEDLNAFRLDRPKKPTSLPFGVPGMRSCVGLDFSLQELQIVLARLLREFRFESVGPPPAIKAGITLRPHPRLMQRASRIQSPAPSSSSL